MNTFGEVVLTKSFVAEGDGFDLGIDMLAWMEFKRRQWFSSDGGKKGTSNIEFDIHKRVLSIDFSNFYDSGLQ